MLLLWHELEKVSEGPEGVNEMLVSLLRQYLRRSSHAPLFPDLDSDFGCRIKSTHIQGR